eukprot:GEMP01131595.1.p1 GENE.GEMP01131595.1~~GEMP01131595.1.p1  ORF type:complete len:135 (-),score=20.79 GEMP01131595.1:118-522(-)
MALEERESERVGFVWRLRLASEGVLSTCSLTLPSSARCRTLRAPRTLWVWPTRRLCRPGMLGDAPGVVNGGLVTPGNILMAKVLYNFFKIDVNKKFKYLADVYPVWDFVVEVPESEANDGQAISSQIFSKFNIF